MPIQIIRTFSVFRQSGKKAAAPLAAAPKRADDTVCTRPSALFSSHAYKFVSWKYRHVRASPARRADPRRFRAGALQKSAGACAVSALFNPRFQGDFFQVFPESLTADLPAVMIQKKRFGYVFL